MYTTPLNAKMYETQMFARYPELKRLDTLLKGFVAVRVPCFCEIEIDDPVLAQRLLDGGYLLRRAGNSRANERVVNDAKQSMPVQNVPDDLYRQLDLRQRHCHSNSSLVYQTDPTRYTIVTGYATNWYLKCCQDNMQIGWFSHTWLIDTTTNTFIETTLPASPEGMRARAMYFGSALTSSEAEMFAKRAIVNHYADA